MDNFPLIAVRAVHFAATAVSGGVVLFLVAVLRPALAETREAEADAAEFHARCIRLASGSVAVVLVTALLWAMLEAAAMSGESFGAALRTGLLWTVLGQTTFGLSTDVRFGLALLLAISLALTGAHRGMLWLGLAAAAGLLGGLAWTGHAAATEGWTGTLHRVADVLHLLAAGAWIGSLVPLAMVLTIARRRADSRWAAIARGATARFSTIGVISVGTLLATGIVNTWILSGTLPALFGTGYGHLLLIKIGLFAAMVTLAAVNRLRLTPHLADPQGSTSWRHASHRLTRNAIAETALGLAIFAVVGALGILVPGLHDQPTWPFPYRLAGQFAGDPALDGTTLLALGVTLVGICLIVGGLFWREMRWPMLIGGAVLAANFGTGLGSLFVEAYPTTFYASPTGYAASSIAHGRDLFAEHCVACHGVGGRGDGPAAANMAIKPADLVADHVYAHTDGDLFWWIGHGIGTAMPGFAAVLDDDARWNLVDFIHANADAAHLKAAAGTVSANGYPAPTFSADCPDGSSISIEDLHGQIVHVAVGVFSPDLINAFAERSRAARTAAILIARDPPAELPAAVCAATDENVVRVFDLYRTIGAAPERTTELLIDTGGSLRALWFRGVRPDWANPPAFAQVVETLRATPAQPRSTGGHAHHH